MTYTAEKPPIAESSDALRSRIPGWGADLDPKDRPSVPKERYDPNFSGAHWRFPERQPEKWPRERSVEHKMLTPVFGTVCPPKGLSGKIRRFAYTFSEGRAAHWMLLLYADRVDALESHITSLLKMRPDNPVTESGVLSEFSHHGLSSRAGHKRTDVKHQPLDLVIIGAPWLFAGMGVAAAAKAIGRFIALVTRR